MRRAWAAPTLEEFAPIVNEWAQLMYREVGILPLVNVGELFARSANIIYEQPIGVNNLAHLEALRFK